MPSFRDLLNTARANISEVLPAEAAAMLKNPGTVALDVREPDEFGQGALKGAVHIPRGFLEIQVAGRIPERDAPIVVYCAGGARSAFAAQTLAQLGYTDVVSMTGGFNRWKDEGLAWEAPGVLTPEQRNRYQRHLLLPEVDVEGQVKLLRSKVLLLGAGGLGSPAALWLTLPTCSARSFTTWTEWGSERSILRRKRSLPSTPTSTSSPTTSASAPTTSWTSSRATT